MLPQINFTSQGYQLDFVPCVTNGVHLVPLACDDDMNIARSFTEVSVSIYKVRG